jgi:SAM-dependent methyltransferase
MLTHGGSNSGVSQFEKSGNGLRRRVLRAFRACAHYLGMTPVVSDVEIAYPGKPYVQTHPDRLAVIARLFGHAACDVATARVLEIGCGDATNLIGMASTLPDAYFTGVDLSESAIERGADLARHAGIRNVTLRAMDLCDFAEGQFDYIVAHGVYSWVPEPVRQALLRVSSERLAPGGVAMVSYAVYPGGFLEQFIRAPMLFAAASFDTPQEKIAVARKFAQAVAARTQSPAVRALFDEEWKKIPSIDGFFLHDQLGEEYTPVYFAEFIRQAAAHGLHYLGEANLGDADLGAFPEARGVGATDRIATEQAVDFLRCRRFRQTILCREEARLTPTASALDGLYAAAPAYRGKSGVEALDAAWPGFVACAGLHADDLLLGLYAAGKIELRSAPPPIADKHAPRPRTTALARAQAEMGRPLTNLLHHEVTIEDAPTRQFISKLDGRRTRGEFGKGGEHLLAMLAGHALLRE